VHLVRKLHIVASCEVYVSKEVSVTQSYAKYNFLHSPERTAATFGLGSRVFVVGIYIYIYFFFMALGPNAGHGLILEVSRSHTTHHSR